MVADHFRLNQLVAQAAELARDQQWEDAGRVAVFLDTMLDRHVCTEDEVLFPRISKYMEGNLELLDSEHWQMAVMVQRMLDVSMAATERWAPTRAARKELTSVMGDLSLAMRRHAQREERMLYSAVDRMHGPGLGNDVAWSLMSTSPRTRPEWSWAAALFPSS